MLDLVRLTRCQFGDENLGRAQAGDFVEDLTLRSRHGGGAAGGKLDPGQGGAIAVVGGEVEGDGGQVIV